MGGRRDVASGRICILIAELNNRVRNVLALRDSLISQMRGEGADSAKYVVFLNGRVTWVGEGA